MTEDTGTALINIDRAIFQNDFASLTPAEKTQYAKDVCRSLDINHLTQPIAWIRLNGKDVPYMKKDGTDQLRKKHNISVNITSRDVQDGLLTVHARAIAPNGRTDEDFGVVSMAGLRGAEAANAVMKAVTKAKRRATLSIVGLGFTDESEIEDMTPTFDNLSRATPKLTAESLPPSKIAAPDATDKKDWHEELLKKAAEPVPYRIERRDGEDWGAWCRTMVAAVRSVPDVETIELIQAANADYVAQLFLEDREKHDKLADIIEHEKAKLNADGS